jgi:hypothetical protein
VLEITIPLAESFDESRGEFVTSSGHVLCLEHSLVSLSKWESEYEKAFLGTDNKTDDEVFGYIRMMIIGEIPPEETLSKLSSENMREIDRYINRKMTATWFSEEKVSKKIRETVTSEVIYYWMISLGIPFECQHWHLNRLLTLIRVCNMKNSPSKKMSKAETLAKQRDLNALRRMQSGSKG